MNRLTLVLFGLFLAIVLGCGGGGGTPPQRIDAFGRVLSIETGGPTNPPASVQMGGVSGLTSPADGSFVLQNVASGAALLVVDTLSAGGVFNFNVAPVTATTDLGDLYVGPQKVSLTGTVRSAASAEPVPNALVSFAGRTALTNAQGVFVLTQVAYSSQTTAVFEGIVGSARANTFFPTNFNAFGTPVAGVIALDDILLTPATDTTPPPVPYNIYGRVSPSSSAPGTTVTLLEGGTPARQVTVGSDGFYFFWMPAGTYTLTFQKGALAAPNQTVTLEQSNQVVRRDVTLQ
jgi:hypothetical protein